MKTSLNTIIIRIQTFAWIFLVPVVLTSTKPIVTTNKSVEGTSSFVNGLSSFSSSFSFRKIQNQYNQPKQQQQSIIIQVCQNKDCCKRWKYQALSLPETILSFLTWNNHDNYEHVSAAAAVTIETTSCLSKCGMGPNISIICKQQHQQLLLHDVSDPAKVAFVIESAFEQQQQRNDNGKTGIPEEGLRYTVPSKLVAAVTCMEKAYKGM